MKRKRIWDNQVVIGHMDLSTHSRIEFSLCAKDGIKFVQFRRHFRHIDEWLPTKKGFVLPIVKINNSGAIEMWAAEFNELFLQCLKQSENFELFNEDNAVYKYVLEEDED